MGTVHIMDTNTTDAAVDTPVLATLSPSRASDFKTCPQFYKFKAIDRIPTEPTIYQARGTTVHLALERLFEEPRHERTPERLYDLFREAWTELNTRIDHPAIATALAKGDA